MQKEHAFVVIQTMLGIIHVQIGKYVIPIVFLGEEQDIGVVQIHGIKY